ncbi:MAG TPA: hypothetical protein VE650_09495, partial [Acetobacteraceae bacterium]|nr:hypothetical protein [Acetobacteraceae bacterium]
RATTIGDMARTIARQLGRPDLLHLSAGPETPAPTPTGRLLAGLGFQPRFNLESGLADTIAWWRAYLAAGTLRREPEPTA